MDKGRVKKKSGNFPTEGGGPSDFGSFSHFFLFIFKHGLNHPEMQKNFVHPLVTPLLQVGAPKFGGRYP